MFLTQQRRQPVDVGLTVGVQEGDDFSFSEAGSQQACPDQPLPLLGPQDANLWQPHHVLLQRRLQVLCGGENRDMWNCRRRSTMGSNPQLLYACSLIRPRWHERALMRNRPQMTTSPTRYPTKKDQRKNWTISSHHQTRHLLMPHAANSNVSPEGIYIITHTGINFTFHLLFCTHRLFIITLRQTPDRLWP